VQSNQPETCDNSDKAGKIHQRTARERQGNPTPTKSKHQGECNRRVHNNMSVDQPPINSEQNTLENACMYVCMYVNLEAWAMIRHHFLKFIAVKIQLIDARIKPPSLRTTFAAQCGVKTVA
jgi:hypothetical protein